MTASIDSDPDQQTTDKPSRWSELLPPGKTSVPPPSKAEFTDKDSATEAAKIMSDVWKNEETRFGNLNTRAVAVVSATSLVTTILGFYSKNLFDTSSAGFGGDLRTYATVGIFVSLGLLVLTAAAIVFGVLLPRHRPLFGDNAITRGEALSILDIDNTAFDEYGALYSQLADRSAEKAYWLSLSYVLFFLAVLGSAFTTSLLVWGIK
jgi:hypothetical protein